MGDARILPTDVSTGITSDGESIASYAAGAVETLSQGGIITGRDDGSFDPLATANRAEAATIIYRVMYRFNLL